MVLFSLLPIVLFATVVFFSFFSEVYYQLMKTSKPFAMREFQNSTGFSGFVFLLPMCSLVFLQSLLTNDEHFKAIGNERVSEFNWFQWFLAKSRVPQMLSFESLPESVFSQAYSKQFPGLGCQR